jgi:hypothetical protein
MDGMGWMDRMDGCMGWMGWDGWMDEKMDGMHGWDGMDGIDGMGCDGCMDGWTDGRTEFSLRVGNVVLKAIAAKISVFWGIMLYSPLKVNCHFGETYRLHLHDRRVN